MIRTAAAGQGRSALKIDFEAFDRTKRVLRGPIKKRIGGRVSEAMPLLRSPTSHQKPAHRFAESGHDSGYIFEVDFTFVNNHRILVFFVL